LRRLTLIALVIVASLAFAPSSQAAAPSNATLAKQVKQLQKDVKALKKQVKEAQASASVALIYGACLVAVTADAFQGTWATIDDVSNRATSPRTIYGPQTPVNDYGLCTAVRFPRTPGKVPPDTSVFSAMLAVFR
jgi:outer membrane murein-binding lipoprotein Lpp